MRPLFNLLSVLALATLVAPLSLAQTQEKPSSEIAPPSVPLFPVEVPDSDEPEIPLETLIQRALENSPRLQIARENLKAAQGRAQASRSLPGPNLQLLPALGGNANARDEDILLSQQLDVFGLRRARARVGSADVRRAQADNRLAARALTVEVKTAAAQLFAAQEVENLERAQLGIAQLFRDAAAKRAALGDVPAVQVQRADLEILRGQNDLANAHSVRLARRTALNTLLGALPSAPLRVSLPLEANALALLKTRIETSSPPAEATVFTPPSPSLTDGDSVSPDLMNRPDLASAQAVLETNQAQVQALRRERLPQVELQARHAPFLGRDGGATALRAVITVPLFDFGALKGQRRAAQAAVGAQTATLKLLQQQATAQVENARVQLQSRRENTVRYQNQLVPLALDLLRKTQIGYTQGASTYLEVLEAQRTLRQIQTEYVQALVDVQMTETALDAATHGGLGIEIPSPNFTLRGDAQ